MVVTKSELIKAAAKDYIGKKVYFLSSLEEKIVTGTITSHDEFQFFIGKSYSLAFGISEFFLSLDDMIKWLKDHVETVE